MAFISYISPDAVPPCFRVDDDDNIIRIHGVHPEILKLHYELYVQLMHKPGTLSRLDRELIAVVVSTRNHCHY